jgi:hypothetical protein
MEENGQGLDGRKSMQGIDTTEDSAERQQGHHRHGCAWLYKIWFIET